MLVSKLASRMSIRAKNNTAYLTGDADQMICGKLWRICLPSASYSNTAAVFYASFQRQRFPKAPKKTNSRLNITWNTTQCKAASFFLFSLSLLPTNLPYTSRYTGFSSTCTFSGFTHAWHQGFSTLVHSLYF